MAWLLWCCGVVCCVLVMCAGDVCCVLGAGCCLYVNVVIVLHLIGISEWRGCCCYCELFVCQRADCVACNRS
jgi:hypothetical protein